MEPKKKILYTKSIKSLVVNVGKQSLCPNICNYLSFAILSAKIRAKQTRYKSTSGLIEKKERIQWEEEDHKKR